MQDFQDAFISYGRADSKDFATKLHQHLQHQGLRVWFDQNDIPLGVDYQNQIDDGIEKADNFLYIISPHSVNSPYCLKEIELAISLNKRIIPLLQVEKIDRPIWQSRNPQGTDEEWQIYCEKGLHSSFPNMHPEIAKINWIYFREGIEKFEDSLTQLQALLNHHQNYVKNHTHYLVRSLNWQRAHQHPQSLLAKEDCKAAIAWLKTRFPKEQPPCLPTDLQCEYISESLKHSQQLMTQVFLNYDPAESWLVDRVRQTLMRESWTIWNTQRDVPPGTRLQDAIQRGIEQADNVVYLISQASLRSPQCQQNLDYALSLNKRIIPVLMPETDPVQIPAQLQGLQYIDLTENLNEADYIKDKNQLMRTLTEDADYFEQHKIFLTRSLKWQRQNQNPSLLLRGYNLDQAEAWLKIAPTKSPYLPTHLHDSFIQASLQNPLSSIDAFLIYASSDRTFVQTLNDALQNHGKTTWFDQESIASGADFQAEIQRGIEASNHILFIVSDLAIQSERCIQLLNIAQTLNKRIIPIKYQSIVSEQFPTPIAQIQPIDFSQPKSFQQNRSAIGSEQSFLTHLGALIRTLESDREQTQFHTQLLTRALNWQQENYDPGFLLRGKELVNAEQWLRHSAQPAPTELQQRYITTSRRAPLRKPKGLTVLASSLGAALAVFLIRASGSLEALEFATYDQLMRSKPNEPQDKRILLVEIDDEDIKQQNKRYPTGVRGGSLPDPALNLLLEKLQAARPQGIGLDLYRDFSTDQPKLAQTFRSANNLVVLCKLQYQRDEGVAPPPELPSPPPPDRLGFSDLAFDDRTIVRRQVLLDQPTPPECNTDRAFAFTLAHRYLTAQGKTLKLPFDADGNFIQDLQWDKTRIPRLYPYSAGYWNQINRGGYQTLINYRRHRGKAHQFIERVTLRSLFDNQVPPEQIRDRIVIIGITARASVNDYSITPVGELPGVIIQAQLVSQLISAVLDRRPLIWWWTGIGDGIWILAWASLGGALVWMSQRPRTVAIAQVGLILILVGIGSSLFWINGGWIPVIPAAIAFVSSGVMVVLLTNQILGTQGLKLRATHKSV